MSDNFYSPPKSNVERKPPEYRGSPLKAISLCALFDIVTTFIVSILFVMFYSSYLYSQGVSADEIEALLKTLDYTHPLGMILMALGLSISVYAGYLCAKMTNYNEYVYGLILGLVLVVYSWLISFDSDNTSALENIIFSVVNIIVVIIGAHGYVKGKAKPVE